MLARQKKIISFIQINDYLLLIIGSDGKRFRIVCYHFVSVNNLSRHISNQWHQSIDTWLINIINILRLFSSLADGGSVIAAVVSIHINWY